jgi:predicted AAA+ superfamily ATPase
VYQPRLIDGLLEKLMADFPAVVITGPRATGKTTTAVRHANSVVRLDRKADAEAYRADPDSALGRQSEPVLLDEWQAVPEVLGAVKRAVDQNSRPGRFLITGSVRAMLSAETWPGTGRVLTVPMYGLTVSESQGRPDKATFLDMLATGGTPPSADRPPDLAGYLDIALASGYPEPLLLRPARSTARWLESYVEQLITRDAPELQPGRDPDRLRRYFEALALNTAGFVEQSTLARAAGVDNRTAAAYEQLLRNLLVVHALPAWTSNRLKRLVRGPKRHLTDVALLGGAVGLDTVAVLAEGALLGRVLETFVLAQLRAELPACRTRPRLYHLREEQGRREVDIVVEFGGRRIIGIEVKAGAPTQTDARHLAWLRDEYGDRFLAGVILHTGPHMYELGARITAAPIAALWS